MEPPNLLNTLQNELPMQKNVKEIESAVKLDEQDFECEAILKQFLKMNTGCSDKSEQQSDSIK